MNWELVGIGALCASQGLMWIRTALAVRAGRSVESEWQRLIRQVDDIDVACDTLNARASALHQLQHDHQSELIARMPKRRTRKAKAASEVGS